MVSGMAVDAHPGKYPVRIRKGTTINAMVAPANPEATAVIRMDFFPWPFFSIGT
jgi:hypothetical protein